MQLLESEFLSNLHFVYRTICMMRNIQRNYTQKIILEAPVLLFVGTGVPIAGMSFDVHLEAIHLGFHEQA